MQDISGRNLTLSPDEMMCTLTVTMYMRWLTLITSSQCSNLASYFEPLLWTLLGFSCPSNKALQWIQSPRHIFAVSSHTSHTQIQRMTHGCFPKMESSSYSKELSLSPTMQMSVWTSYGPTTTTASQDIRASARRFYWPQLI